MIRRTSNFRYGLGPCAHQARTDLRGTFFWNVTLVDLPMLWGNLPHPSLEQKSLSITEKGIWEDAEDKTVILTKPEGIKREKNICRVSFGGLKDWEKYWPILSPPMS
jgi:hypothetical protein